MMMQNDYKAFLILTSVVLSLLFIHFTGLHAQSVDSIKVMIAQEGDSIEKGDLYTRLALRYLRIDVDQAEQFIDTAAMISDYAADYESSNWIQYMRAKVAQRRQKLDTALVILHQLAANHEVDTLEKKTIGNIYYSIGDINRIQQDFERAVLYINKAKEIYRADNDIASFANANILLGAIYKDLKQYDQAIQYFSEAYDTYEILENYDAMATAILNNASVYARQKKYDESLEKYMEAEEIANKLEGADNLMSYIYGNRASLYESLGQPQKAYSEMLAAYELRKKNASPREIVNSLIGLSVSSMKLGNNNRAKRFLDQVKNIVGDNVGMLEFETKYFQTLSRYYKNTGQLRRALESKDQFIMLKDSSRQIELDKKVIELNEQLETEQKEKEIIQLSSQKEIADAKVKSSRRVAILSSLGLFIISLLSVGLFYFLRKTKSQNSVIAKALSDKELLLKEIHHRVKNNLHFISALLGLQTDHVSDEVALGALKEGQDRVQSMALIHQDLYQRDDLTSVNMKEYFEKLIEGLFDSYNIRTDSISLNMEVQELHLDVDTVVPIGLIVNELVSNSLKYAFDKKQSGIIKVSLIEHQEKLVLEVSDNGSGMDQTTRDSLGQSLGFKLIYALTDQLEGEISMDTSHGTEIKILMNKYQKSKNEVI